MSDRSSLVLVVEDSDDDFYAFRRACRKLSHPVTVRRCVDVDAAREYLSAAIEARCPMPSMVLLDLHLAGSDGRVLLREMKADLKLRPIPVVIYSTSQSPDDVRQCLGAHANAYHVKPLEFDQMVSELQNILGYWAQHPLTLSAVS